MNYYSQPPLYPGYGQNYGGVPPHSGVGIASFVLGLLSLLSVIGMFAMVASMVSQAQRSRVRPEDPELAMAGCTVIAAGVLALVGAILGLVGVNQQNRRRAFAVAGLIINVLVLLAMGILFLVQKTQH
jgi:hypothetical protein